MVVKDKQGTKITLYQSRAGKICIPIANRCITLSKADAETFTLYDIEDFDHDLFLKAYSSAN